MQTLAHNFVVDHGPVFDTQNYDNNIIKEKHKNYPAAL